MYKYKSIGDARVRESHMRLDAYDALCIIPLIEQAKNVMKIEVGKTYKTRGGWKVEVVSFNVLSPICFAAWVYPGEDVHLQSYNSRGYPGLNLGGCTPLDIMSEWKEEPLHIVGPGIFRTKDGKEAEVTLVLSIDTEHPVKGYIQNSGIINSWTKTGISSNDFSSEKDLVERIR